MAARLFRCRDHLVLRRVGLAEEDVRADRVVEEVDVLEHHRDVREQTVAGKFAQVVSADRNAAALRVVKAREQTANGRLAAARRADDGGRGLLGDGKRHVLEDLSLIVAEVDVVEADVVAAELHIVAVRVDEVLTSERVELVHRVVDDAECVRAVADGLKARKNAEREEDEHQHDGKIHLPVQTLHRRREREAHAAALEREQMQGVGGHIAPLNF